VSFLPPSSSAVFCAAADEGAPNEGAKKVEKVDQPLDAVKLINFFTRDLTHLLLLTTILPY
jgi:hypothetical protein